MSDLEKFRTETRAWLEENCPPSMRTPMPEDESCWGGRNATYKNPDTKIWLDRMAARGWTAPAWPKEYGGGGLDKAQAQVLQQELSRIRARPPLQSFGIWMLGPALLEFASEEQKNRFLPPIVRGEIRWCQGYSEPGAGSDLAGLQTKAEDKGDHYLVNGSKIWTSYGNYADWIFCLVRTDPKAPKHKGISFLLFDMTTPGASTRPIKLISGASVFTQTFFEDVKVPKDQLVGPLNEGWTIAKALLQHERNMIAGIGGSNMPGGSGQRSPSVAAKRYAGEIDGRIADPALRLDIARHNMNSRAFAITGQRMADELKAGAPPGPASSMFKYYGTEQNKRKYELLLQAMGTAALGWEGEGFQEHELGITREWLRSKGNSIEGGTSEVQLNVIAKNVLRLPD
jgi:alkylation response protein AidB-like acyl-CoA dehydrogenase